MAMPLVIIESPYAGKSLDDLAANITYARRCLRNSVLLGEAPIASHLLYTQPGVLDDLIPEERELGIQCGLAWSHMADYHVFYTDKGWSPGMTAAFRFVRRHFQEYRIRALFGEPQMLSEEELK